MAQLVATMHGCSAAICDKVKQSAEGAIQAIIEFITRRGNELNDADVSRFLMMSGCMLYFSWAFLSEILCQSCLFLQDSPLFAFFHFIYNRQTSTPRSTWCCILVFFVSFFFFCFLTFTSLWIKILLVWYCR